MILFCKNLLFFKCFRTLSAKQHSKLSEEQLAGKIFLGTFLYICFRAWGVKFCIFCAKPRQVVKVCPGEQPKESIFVDEKFRKKFGYWATIFWAFGQKFLQGCQKCILTINRGVFRYLCFWKNLLFFKCFCTRSRKVSHTWRNFLQFFSKLFQCGQRNILRWGVFFEKVFVFILKVLRIFWKSFFFVDASKQVFPNSNLQVLNSLPK